MTTATRTTTKPGELARLTAAILADAGFRVTTPDPGDAGGRRLFIWSPTGPYSLTVDDDASAELEGDHDDPHHAADVAAALLSPAPSAARHPDAIANAGITFKGIAGMDLKAKGFNVALDVHIDDYYYDVSGDIIVTGPDADTDADAGIVYVDDAGGLTWCRDYWPAHAGTGEREPQFRLPDPSAVARDIADDVSRALRTGHDLPAACLPSPGESQEPMRDAGLIPEFLPKRLPVHLWAEEFMRKHADVKIIFPHESESGKWEVSENRSGRRPYEHGRDMRRDLEERYPA